MIRQKRPGNGQPPNARRSEIWKGVSLFKKLDPSIVEIEREKLGK